jgi:hypothetical protein
MIRDMAKNHFARARSADTLAGPRERVATRMP